MFNEAKTIIGSGLFVCKPLLLQQQVKITGPYVKPSAPLEPVCQETGPQADIFVARTKQSQGVFSVSQAVLASYAQKVVEVARIIKENAYDIVLCPMRGARLPGLQSNLICQSEPFEPFDGTDLAKRVNDERILDELRRLIYERSCASQRRRIGILDTAVGGDSCREFARLLRLLNDQTKENWVVHFHLIHAEERRPPRANEAWQFSNATMGLEISYHEVLDLLIEDERRLLGYDVDRRGVGSHIVPFQQEGQILVFGPKTATLYRRAPLDETMIALVASEIGQQIQTLPDITPVNLDL